MAFGASPAIRRELTSPMECIRFWAELEYSRRCGAAPAASRLTLRGMAVSLPTSQEIIIRTAPLGSFFDRVDCSGPRQRSSAPPADGPGLSSEEAEHGN